MKAEELRALETIDLRAKVAALEEDLFKVRLQQATAQLSDTSKILKARRLFARAKTILHERERADAAAGK
ncbi:MAG: 50S ribosomal protein L29 [Deltaproteobacteria bacterium]|nr:MAG: 50S ribosomal protein L29 [Deltaproteobacteria bacterium]